MFHTLLPRHSFTSLQEANDEVAVQHVLCAIHPYKLKKRFYCYVAFIHHGIKKDFAGYFKHAEEISDAFLLIHSATVRCEASGLNEESAVGEMRHHNKSGLHHKGNLSKPDVFIQDEPICPWEPQRLRGRKHKLKEPRNCLS